MKSISSIKIVSRQEWDADSQEGEIPPLKLPATNIFFTYTGSEQCTSNSNTLPPCHNVVKRLQQEALYDYNLPDIPYNFLLGGDGCVYEGRGWNLKPEPIPNEPELNERNTLVVAYIGKKEDDIPKYRKKVLQRTHEGFLDYCIYQGHIVRQPLISYAEETPLSPTGVLLDNSKRDDLNEGVRASYNDDGGGVADDDFDDVENGFDEDNDDFDDDGGFDDDAFDV